MPRRGVAFGNHLFDRKAGACPQVEHLTAFALKQLFDAFDGVIDQIHHMDVVTHAGAVWHRIIRAIDGRGASRLQAAASIITRMR